MGISFKEIKSIETIDDNSVMATILVADKYTDTNFDLKLKLAHVWQRDFLKYLFKNLIFI